VIELESFQTILIALKRIQLETISVFEFVIWPVLQLNWIELILADYNRGGDEIEIQPHSGNN